MSSQQFFFLFTLMTVVALGIVGCGDDGSSPPPPVVDAGIDADAADDTSPEPDVAVDTGPDVPLTDEEKVLAITETASWTLPGLVDEVQIVRTDGNVPHIFATNRTDIGFALGFVLAQDRFFFMDLQRRLPTGTLSDLLGDLLLPVDIESRLTGMGVVTELLLANLNDEDAAYFDAYAAGVNAYIDRVAAGELPPPTELTLVGFLFEGGAVGAMKPFDRRSVAAMVATIFYWTNFDGRDVARQARADRLDTLFEGAALMDLRRSGARDDIWERVDPPYATPSAPSFGLTVDGVSQKGDPTPRGATSGSAPTVLRRLPPSLLDRASERLEARKNLLFRREDGNFGSNAWAVSGTHTTDGAALVAGDGHLQFMIPSIMYQAGFNTELFGGGNIHQSGLLIAGLPFLAVGTNGNIAFSQVNPESDITDWYREEINLDADGLPDATLFEGEWQSLNRIDEVYTIADVPLLGSVGRAETFPRWTTADGRMLFDVEGRVLADDEDPADGEAVVLFTSSRVVPGDVDGDGVVSGISFDSTGFDATQYVRANENMALAADVREYSEATKGLVGNMLFAAVVDQAGESLYSSYQAIPCRGYLPREADGRWIDGADPTQLIDGTIYPSFTIPSDENGLVDEAPGAADPTRCVVPFDETPRAINPPEGYVVTANNEPAPIVDDGIMGNEPWHLGGPYASIRAHSIARELQEAVDDGVADMDKMSEIQANDQSPLGELFAPSLLEAIATARQTRDAGATEPHEQRLVAIYESEEAAMDEVASRLVEWMEGGFHTPSGVETFYHDPTDDDLRYSVATMIFNAWLPRALDGTFADEGMEDAWRFDRSRARMWSLHRILEGRGSGNPGALASWNVATGESVFFDVLGTDEVERFEEVFLTALVGALEFLRTEPLEGATGGFGTNDMSAWLWGLRHRVRIESPVAGYLPPDTGLELITDLIALNTSKLPLADELPAGDPRRGLDWFPRGGDNYTVDVAGPGYSGTTFDYGYGPQMRMVIALKDGRVTGRNILPTGQSGLTDSPYFSDQAELWLANETLPLYFHVEDVVEGAIGRERLSPGQ